MHVLMREAAVCTVVYSDVPVHLQGGQQHLQQKSSYGNQQAQLNT